MKYFRIIIILLITIIFINNYYIYGATQEPELYSEAAILIEASTGKIIYQKNAFQEMYPASTTKIMTAILTLENCKLSDTAVASEYAVTSIPSGYATADIQVGEILTIEDLLYVLMLRSANEAATILAEHIGGSESKFVEMMNNKAKEIGCKHTHFVNANGIQNDEHYSTAYDLALMAKYAMQNSSFREIVSATSYTLSATNLHELEDRTIVNTNDLVIPDDTPSPYNYYYPYATGIKTGYTSAAKNCLVSSSSKDGLDLITVVLYAQTTEDGFSERYLDTISLFNYGYDNFENFKFFDKNELIDTISIPDTEEELNLLLENDIIAFIEKNNIDLDAVKSSKKINIDENNLKTPIHARDVIGTITYTINNEDYTQNIIAERDILKPQSSSIISIVLVGLFILIIIFNIILIIKQSFKFHVNDCM